MPLICSYATTLYLCNTFIGGGSNKASTLEERITVVKEALKKELVGLRNYKCQLTKESMEGLRYFGPQRDLAFTLNGLPSCFFASKFAPFHSNSTRPSFYLATIPSSEGVLD